ncbi:MAG: glycosyltransferase 61 family protein [Cyanobacteriota bacterium]
MSVADRAILCEAIEDHVAGRGFDHAFTMDVFTRKGDIKKAGDYLYRDLSSDKLYFFNRVISKAGSLILDEELRIIPESNIMLGYPHLLIDHLPNFLKLVQSVDSAGLVNPIEGPALAIQTWFVTYGHFHDEIFALADFLKQTGWNHCPIVDYPPSDNMSLNYRTSVNYERLQSLVLSGRAYNLFEAGSCPVGLHGALVINHLIDSPAFHLFPERIRDHIASQVSAYQPNIPSFSFISRETASHLPRNISNQDQVEALCEASSFPVVYPERLSYDRLVRRLQVSSGIVITWGGALTNLVYLSKRAKVLILKSASYRHETLDLFRKIISQRELEVEVLDTDDEDCIDLKVLEDKLTSLMR